MLTEARQQLLISEKLAALGELSAGVAHEINNPLAVILGNVELMKLELGEAAEPVSEELALVLTQIERIRAITRSLLQYSRPGDYETAPVWQHLNPIIEESLTWCAPPCASSRWSWWPISGPSSPSRRIVSNCYRC